MNQYDIQLFQWINLTLTNAFFDWLMPLITDLHKSFYFTALFFPIAHIYWAYKEKKKSLILIPCFLLSLAFSDLFSYRVVKHFVQQPRPPVSGIEVVVRSPYHGQYGFTSNHAANTFAIATFVGLTYVALKLPLFVFAFLISFSRIYNGVHFPSDVLGGALIGIFFGYLMYRISLLLLKRFQNV